MRNLELIADGVIASVKSYVASRFAEIEKRVADIPAGPVGPVGAQGEPGPVGPAGPAGERGEAGIEGKSITVDDVRPLFELAFAKWETDFERRAQDVFAKAIERMPKAKDGIDGLGFDDLMLEHDGSGLVYLHFVRGEQRKDFELRLPCFRDRGVYSEESKDYREGHGTTWGGSYFIAQKDNPQGRPGESDDWRLAVKRGRDGKDGIVPALLHKPVALK